MTTHDELIELFHKEKFSIEQFHKRIINFFLDNPELNNKDTPIIHSIKHRIKNEEHLKEKITRKQDVDNPITLDILFDKITDFAGVRILHLFSSQFIKIHEEIKKQIDAKEWYFFEEPIAYTWDPEHSMGWTPFFGHNFDIF